MVGTTYSPDYPTTPGAFDRTLGGRGDAFVARFDPTASTLTYGSFLGGEIGGDRNLDQGFAIAAAGPGPSPTMPSCIGNPFQDPARGARRRLAR